MIGAHRGGYQPYARGPRAPGSPLYAMLRGRPFFLPHPMDVQRQQMALRKRLMLMRRYL